eukprot:15123319-Alexandrium_andersonii.AAC.1
MSAHALAHALAHIFAHACTHAHADKVRAVLKQSSWRWAAARGRVWTCASVQRAALRQPAGCRRSGGQGAPSQAVAESAAVPP